MPSIKFSVVIATIGSPHLEKIVKVFLSYDKQIEVIIVIDNPDISTLLLQTPLYADPRVKIISNQSNIGLTRSLNKAIANASGDIIVRSDDDDISSTSRIDEIEIFFNAHPEVDLVYSFAEGQDEIAGHTWVLSGPQDDMSIKQTLLRRNFIVHSTIAFRRERFSQIEFYNETFRYAQDYDLYLRAIDAGFVFGCIPKVLLTRAYHKNSITVSKRKRQIMNSMAARILHVARQKEKASPWRVLRHYIILLAIPNWARNLRRRLGYGK